MKKTLSICMAAAVMAVGITGLCACDVTDPIVLKEGLTIKIGITEYEPMDYREAGSDKWIGFDAELSEKVFTNLGCRVVFEEINWETKVVTLNSGKIDVIWNGMTVTEELKKNITLSDVYLENRQYGLVKTENASSYRSAEDLKNKKVAFESGSAAQELLEEISCTKNQFETQSAAVMEVAAGTSDVAVVDYTMAVALTSAGSDYAGRLTAVDLGFAAEEYAVGFRKIDTELCKKVNEQIAALTQSGYMKTLAEKYGVENLLKVK